MKQMWVKMIEVEDEMMGGKVRQPDFGEHTPRMWCAVVGEPFGMNPDLPKFMKPLGDYMLIEMEDAEERILTHRDADKKVAWRKVQMADVPDEIQMITEITKADKDDAKLFESFEKRKEQHRGLIGRTRSKRALVRMVTQGVVGREQAKALAEAHQLDRVDKEVVK